MQPATQKGSIFKNNCPNRLFPGPYGTSITVDTIGQDNCFRVMSPQFEEPQLSAPIKLNNKNFLLEGKPISQIQSSYDKTRFFIYSDKVYIFGFQDPTLIKQLPDELSSRSISCIKWAPFSSDFLGVLTGGSDLNFFIINVSEKPVISWQKRISGASSFCFGPPDHPWLKYTVLFSRKDDILFGRYIMPVNLLISGTEYSKLQIGLDIHQSEDLASHFINEASRMKVIKDFNFDPISIKTEIPMPVNSMVSDGFGNIVVVSNNQAHILSFQCVKDGLLIFSPYSSIYTLKLVTVFTLDSKVLNQKSDIDIFWSNGVFVRTNSMLFHLRNERLDKVASIGDGIVGVVGNPNYCLLSNGQYIDLPNSNCPLLPLEGSFVESQDNKKTFIPSINVSQLCIKFEKEIVGKRNTLETKKSGLIKKKAQIDERVKMLDGRIRKLTSSANAAKLRIIKSYNETKKLLPNIDNQRAFDLEEETSRLIGPNFDRLSLILNSISDVEALQFMSE